MPPRSIRRMLVLNKEKTTLYCGLWCTHRESNPELSLRSKIWIVAFNTVFLPENADKY